MRKRKGGAALDKESMANGHSGGLKVKKMRDYVEVHLTTSMLDSSRVYAFALNEPLNTLFDAIREDVGDASLEFRLECSIGETDSVVSPKMVHAYAWGAGSSRQLRIGEALYDVTVVGEKGLLAQDAQLTPRKRHISDVSRGRKMKYVVVTGGVVSGIGKGVTASSIGMLLKSAGYRVNAIKIDPYINMDAGTMSPFEHGEVFVLDDGGEADLDLGNYERFMDLNLARDNNITTGKIYQNIIERERKGEFLGKTVQVVPHVTNTIQEWIERVAHAPADGKRGAPDVTVIELGGTVGDIESMPFIEALRQFQWKVGRDNFVLTHVSLVPVVGAVGEEKTKPTQHSVQSLRALGLSPDFLMCRSTKPLEDKTKEKLANFCHVPPEQCMGMHDVSNIYRVPLLLEEEGILDALLQRLELERQPTPLLGEWGSLAELVDTLSAKVSIAIVGKYTSLGDAYLSVTKVRAARRRASPAARPRRVPLPVPALWPCGARGCGGASARARSAGATAGAASGGGEGAGAALRAHGFASLSRPCMRDGSIAVPHHTHRGLPSAAPHQERATAAAAPRAPVRRLLMSPGTVGSARAGARGLHGRTRARGLGRAAGMAARRWGWGHAAGAAPRPAVAAARACTRAVSPSPRAPGRAPRAPRAAVRRPPLPPGAEPRVVRLGAQARDRVDRGRRLGGAHEGRGGGQVRQGVGGAPLRRRHPRARRVWRPRRRGQDPRRAVRARERRAVLRHLPGLSGAPRRGAREGTGGGARRGPRAAAGAACRRGVRSAARARRACTRAALRSAGGCDRVRAQRARLEGRALAGVRRELGAQGGDLHARDLEDAHGRHDAPRLAPRRPQVDQVPRVAPVRRHHRHRRAA